MAEATVVIGVATYRRPRGLARLIASLDALRFDSDPAPSLSVLVVDNDAQGSAAATCRSAAAGLRWPLTCRIEAARGIAPARNHALRFALDRADFLAFVDDDEVPEPGWLAELLRVQRAYDADVVAGPVLPRFESAPPAWIERGGFFDLPRYATGAPLTRAYTGNVLMRLAAFARDGLWFDDRLALTGGEDVQLFTRAARAGHRMVWADEALVHEWVPQTRVNARWLLRRAYRIGNSASVCDRDLGMSHRARGLRVARAVARVGRRVAALPLAAVTGRHAVLRTFWAMSVEMGYLAGVTGRRYEEYRAIHGG